MLPWILFVTYCMWHTLYDIRYVTYTLWHTLCIGMPMYKIWSFSNCYPGIKNIGFWGSLWCSFILSPRKQFLIPYHVSNFTFLGKFLEKCPKNYYTSPHKFSRYVFWNLYTWFYNLSKKKVPHWSAKKVRAILRICFRKINRKSRRNVKKTYKEDIPAILLQLIKFYDENGTREEKFLIDSFLRDQNWDWGDFVEIKWQ